MEVPFDIPDSWEWVRGTHILMETANEEPCSNFTYIDIDAINNKRHLIAAPKRIKASDAPSRARRKLQEGDTLFSLVRPYLENVAYVSAEFSSAIASTGFFVIRSEKEINKLYVFHMFLSPYVIQGLNNFMKGDNSPSIRGEHIWNFLLPIPPLQEQYRIVEKLKSLLKLVDDTK